MDLSSLVGLVGGFTLILCAVLLKGGGLGYFDLSSLMIVVGGTLAAALVTHPLPHLGQLRHVLRVAFARQAHLTASSTVDRIVHLSEIARREGLLAIEQAAASLDEPFLQKGMQLIVDGIDPETVHTVLELEVARMQERHRAGQALFETMGSYAPAFGMIGTLIGLVQMLGNLDNPAQIGPSMAVALLTTFYGAILAYLVFLPIANKLRLRSEEEAAYQQMVLQGVLSIQSGENPRLLREKLLAFLHSSSRVEKPKAEKNHDTGGDVIET